MNIAILTVSINTHSGSRAPIELARHLSMRKHLVTLIATNKNIQSKLVANLLKEKIKLITINSSGLFASYKVYKELRGKFDIISFHSTLFFFLGAKFSFIPIITTYYGSQFNAIKDKFFPYENFLIIYLNWLGNIYIKLISLFILKSSAKIVAISKFTKKEIKSVYNIKSDYCYLGSSVEFKRLKKIKNKNKVLTILSVSRIVPYKGFHQLIKIVNELRTQYPYIRLIIVGSVENEKYYRYIHNLSVNHISLLTNTPDTKLFRLYLKSDIYATCDRYPFFGLPLVEAQAAGLPVVALNYGAVSEIIKHRQTGFVANTLTEFSDFLSKLVDDESLRKKFAITAINRSEKFNWERTAVCYEKIYKKYL